MRKWTYEQTTGRLYDQDGKLEAKGYAGGNCGKNPEGVNNPAMHDCKGIGPLPVGLYTFGQMIERHPHLGPFAIPLIPDAGNEMFGRSDFFMHGDTTPPGNASKGCIIMPRAVRLECARSAVRVLQVVSIVEQGDLA